ncbi:sensor histidine kinase [Kineosporia succinea]|uniref:sensor histidine kinase n=1 Tax=Kineosporia succinea TaxID=84632 RepID=UPI0027D91A8F|nr:ATP-binding protein [Kineosporia succinea]
MFWLAALLAGSTVTAVASIGISSLWAKNPALAAPTVVFAGALVAVGVILAREPGQGPAGRAIVLAGCVWPLSWVEEITRGPLHLVSFLAAPLTLVLAAWAIFGYPDPASVGRAERRFLFSLTAWVLVGRVLVVVSSDLAAERDHGAAWWPTVQSDPGFHRTLAYVSSVGEVLLATGFLILWVRRSRRIRGLDRKLLLPVAGAAAIAGTASMCGSLAQVMGVRGDLLDDILVLQTTLLLTVPVAFVVATVRRRLASVVIADLLPLLRVERTPERLEEAFRKVLGDPGLEIHYWAAEIGAYVDRHGATKAEPGGETGEEALLLPITSTNGSRLAIIRADQALWRYPDLVEAVGSAAGLAIENARLQVEARAQLELVRASHARIVAAQLAERQALEKDLDDGALRRVQDLLTTIEPVEGIEDAVGYAAEQLRATVAELREIAAGLHPSILDRLGLAEAVRRIGQAQPVTVAVDLPDRLPGLPMAAQVAGYFVAAEAITNAVRHAAASRIDVRGADTGRTLRLTIEDDGRGGADLAAGTGLSGLDERVRAAGGTLLLESPPGAGTTLTAEIPYR